LPFVYRMDEWNKHELIEFFGVLPEEDDDKTYLSFAIEKDGLLLNATFFQYFFDVYLSIFRVGIKEPAFTTKIEASPGLKYVKHANGWECLEIAAPLLKRAVLIKINPHISVETFQPAAA
jgi:hypothetical protein